MANPFLRRATEYIKDDSAFLSIVSPEPLTTFVARHPKKDAILDLPVRVIGSPGSGKTMLATLVEFRLVEAILRDQSSDNNRALAAALAACNLIDGDVPLVAAVRLPMEFEYRDFWELPYDAQLKTKLILSLVQARAILGLFRNLTAGRRRDAAGIRFIGHEGAHAQLEQIGGLSATDIRERARAVERAIYSIGAGLLPPDVADIPAEAREPYQPFAVIREVEIDWNGKPIRLKPLVVLDDVHTLHPEQFESLFRALSRREIKIGRWMMMRMDALSPSTVFRSDEDEAIPGLKRDRDFIDIFMQSRGERGDERRQFRRMATDMADRYLSGVTVLRERNFVQFGRLLAAEPPTLPAGKIVELRNLIDREQKQLEVTNQRRGKLEKLVEMYVRGTKSYDTGEDVRLAMVRVLINRYAIRVAQETPVLFEAEDPEPRTPLKADASVADAARIHLHDKFGRPYHYGLENLCDASSENAELFLQLAGALVSRMETKVIRNLDPALTPSQQQAELSAKANEIVENWSFPFSRKVRALVDQMAEQCVKITQLPNARLGAGANAVGVPEAEMAKLLASGAELALILKFAIAYGAITAIRNYGQGGKTWCLLELCGPICLRYGLTLKRGGFLERHVEELSKLIEVQ